MNQDLTITAFREPITALADTPNLSAAELKRRFQAPAEELRQAHNALAETVKGITDATYPETVSEGMLTAELAEKINGKAEQSALEAAEEATADSLAEISESVSAVREQVAAKCEVVFGTYEGDGQTQQEVTLGFQPSALITTDKWGRSGYGNDSYGGLVFPNLPSSICSITETGFLVTGNASYVNRSGDTYKFIAFK